MRYQKLFEFEWAYILKMLPELESSAKEFGAIERRREIKSAEALLRLALVYGFCDRSLRETAAWGEASGVCNVSDVALLKRFRRCGQWLGSLVARKIAERSEWSGFNGELPIRIVDATTISLEGSKGTDWRIHLEFDLQRLAIKDIELTDARQGESLKRFQWEPGELVLADRGYAHREGLFSVARCGAYFLVRLNWRNVPLETVNGETFDLLGFLRSLPDASAQEAAVVIRDRNGQALPCRLIAIRKSESAAARSRAKTIRERKRKCRTIDPRTLETAGYTFLLTSLPSSSITAEEALELYRFRWQIEIAFKRLKSLVHIDHLKAKEPALVRTYLLAKLLGALLVEDLTERYISFSPWGYPIRRFHATCLHLASS